MSVFALIFGLGCLWPANADVLEDMVAALPVGTPQNVALVTLQEAGYQCEEVGKRTDAIPSVVGSMERDKKNPHFSNLAGNPWVYASKGLYCERVIVMHQLRVRIAVLPDGRVGMEDGSTPYLVSSLTAGL